MSTVLPDYVEPPVVKPFLGKVLDGDGHMYMDPQTLREIAGPLDGGHMVTFLEEFMNDGRYEEAREKNVRELWNVKGIGAMGALDTTWTAGPEVGSIMAVDSPGLATASIPVIASVSGPAAPADTTEASAIGVTGAGRLDRPLPPRGEPVART